MRDEMRVHGRTNIFQLLYIPSLSFFLFFFLFFFFLLHPRHTESPGPGIEPESQQRQHQVLNLLSYQGTPPLPYFRYQDPEALSLPRPHGPDGTVN